MLRLHLRRHLTRSAYALAVAACIGLAITATATARPADKAPQPAVHNAPAQTAVKQTVLRPDDGGPGTLTLVLIGIAGGIALLGAGYLGARSATRTAGVPAHTAVSVDSPAPAHSGPVTRTGT